MARPRSTLTDLARLGFTDLSAADAILRRLEERVPAPGLAEDLGASADPDLALRSLDVLAESAPGHVQRLVEHEGAVGRLVRLLGASEGLGEFLRRNPAELAVLHSEPAALPTADEYRAALAPRLPLDDPEAAGDALRVCYRTELARLAAWDLTRPAPVDAVPVVATALADLAGAALDGALAIARAVAPFPADQVAATRLAVIGMGKAGARELNYVSDVDVILVAEPAEPAEPVEPAEPAGDAAVDRAQDHGGATSADPLDADRALAIATWLAKTMMRFVHEYGREPGLWEVDANLRPEGRAGALVRSLESHLAYYDRWAKSWEFQALLKARPLAGDAELGARYVAGVAPRVWSSASRESFVESVQRMRERVTEHIPPGEVDVQLKLGPGGLRDIEFTVQLLQLVHGRTDDGVRAGGTLPALAALAEGGYIGRAEAAEFSRDYRVLRLLEHRLQLSRLRRTHLMPRDDDALRVLGRASGLGAGARELSETWTRVRRAVRSLHERLFYRPLLSAVAALGDDGITLTSDQAGARLAAIGFRDPAGALGHIRALTSGVSRRAAIQRTLLPVMLQWFADGADPDNGLLAFRRLSDDLGESYWFLRMLRDSSGAAQRLTGVLAGARFVGVLLERLPEAAAWFEHEDDLRPRPLSVLLDEVRATLARHDDPEAAAAVLRVARRREVLRLAIGAVLGAIDVVTLGRALADVTTALLTGVLRLAREQGDGIEFGIIALGRYGGGELGFGSDADVVHVYRATTATGEEAQRTAQRIVQRVNALTEDLRLPLHLDTDLRPEGRTGPIVRSLDSYRAYYARWSLTWEAQALLRACGAAGDDALLRDFEALADDIRYPRGIPESDVREVRRIKARVESERLPQGADRSRHLKLGRGSLSDVEWCVQLIQLQHGAEVPELRTTSTLSALAAAARHGFLRADEATRLRDAWILASRARSAMALWMVRSTDSLPVDRPQLEGVARILEYPPGSASRLEDDYLRVTRLARQVFERRFYGAEPAVPEPSRDRP